MLPREKEEKREREREAKLRSIERNRWDKIKHLFPCFALRDLASSSSRYSSSLIRGHRFNHFVWNTFHSFARWLNESNVHWNFIIQKNRLIVFTILEQLFICYSINRIYIKREIREISFDMLLNITRKIYEILFPNTDFQMSSDRDRERKSEKEKRERRRKREKRWNG